MKTAIILCSGGLDSVVTANYVKKKLSYGKLIVLFFDYQQKTLFEERNASKKCAKKLGAEFVEINLKWLADVSSSLINKDGKIKKLSRKDLKDTKEESDKWYVPCRNTLFLTYALALAESLFIKQKIVSDIFVGFKCEGKEPYPDTTVKYVKAMNNLSKTSCVANFKILAPLIKKDKDEIIKLGQKLGVNFKETFSCYVGKSGKHCGNCLACKLRQEGFYWSGIKDPTDY